MPYVTDTEDNLRNREFLLHHGRYAPFMANSLEGSNRHQFGYRSGRGHSSTSDEFSLLSSPNWATATRRAVDSTMEFNRSSVTFRVNDRDYTERSAQPAIGTISYDGGFGETLSAIRGINPSNWEPTPSDSDLVRDGAPLLRSTVPAAPEADLIRFAAEQKDSHFLFNAANYRPRQIKELGGAYLNVVFGIKPTASDLKRIGETVYNSGPIVRNFINHERKVLRRSRREDILSDSGDRGRVIGLGPSELRKTSSWSTHGASGVYYLQKPPVTGHSWNWPRSVAYQLNETWTHTVNRRVFATYEYFIPRPEGIVGRLSNYQKKAERLLGGGGVSTAWELAPYSWLVDWFIDIGGLLRYQQAVASNNIVSRGSGSTWTQEFVITASARAIKASDIGGVDVPVSSSPAVSVCRLKVSKRRPGSPYSLSPSWDLSGSQAAILGALGTSRFSPI